MSKQSAVDKAIEELEQRRVEAYAEWKGKDAGLLIAIEGFKAQQKPRAPVSRKASKPVEVQKEKAS